MIFNRKNISKKTNLFNKRTLKRHIKKEIKRIARKGETTAALDKNKFPISWEWCVEWLTKKGFACIVSSTDEDIINIFWN